MERVSEQSPAGRVAESVAAAVAELLPSSRTLAIAVDGPDDVERRRARAWLTGSEISASELGDRLGMVVAEADLIGWVSAWSVTASGPGGVATISVLPATEPAELAVELAQWLQDVLVDGGISEPGPPCPGHAHPMLPILHQGAAWWSCPNLGLVRPWQAGTLEAPNAGDGPR